MKPNTPFRRLAIVATLLVVFFLAGFVAHAVTALQAPSSTALDLCENAPLLLIPLLVSVYMR